MNDRLLTTYRRVYEQGFLPIFALDDYPTDILLEGCVRAGFTTIEYTLRRKDARDVISTLRDKFPDMVILIGSTLDSDRIVRQMSARYQQLMTIDELAGYHLDGFVSMLGWSNETISRYCRTHLILVTASTITEALTQIDAGAHFIKMAGDDLDFVKRCRSAATFDFCPVFLTGGMTLENIPLGVEAGGMLVGSGCEVVLAGITPGDVTPEIVCERMLKYQNAVIEARTRIWPQLADAGGLSDQEWLTLLPHFHPFSL